MDHPALTLEAHSTSCGLSWWATRRSRSFYSTDKFETGRYVSSPGFFKIGVKNARVTGVTKSCHRANPLLKSRSYWKLVFESQMWRSRIHVTTFTFLQFVARAPISSKSIPKFFVITQCGTGAEDISFIRSFRKQISKFLEAMHILFINMIIWKKINFYSDSVQRPGLKVCLS